MTEAERVRIAIALRYEASLHVPEDLRDLGVEKAAPLLAESLKQLDAIYEEIAQAEDTLRRLKIKADALATEIEFLAIPLPKVHFDDLNLSEICGLAVRPPGWLDEAREIYAHEYSVLWDTAVRKALHEDG